MAMHLTTDPIGIRWLSCARIGGSFGLNSIASISAGASPMITRFAVQVSVPPVDLQATAALVSPDQMPTGCSQAARACRAWLSQLQRDPLRAADNPGPPGRRRRC